MAKSFYSTIAIQGCEVRKEALADEAIIPGQLLRFDADEELEKHATAGGVLVNKLVALESPTAAPGTTQAIDTAYAIGEIVYYAIPRPGDVCYMFLAAGETAVKGISQLVSDGAGALQVATVDATTLVNSIVGVPAEDKDNSGGGSAVRVLVEIS
jgi:hypothetical protein